MHVELVPRGSFNLETQARYFGGWPRLGDAVAMPFPVEGWRSSAVVVMRQHGEVVKGDVHSIDARDDERAWYQALASTSLDVDATGFAEVGKSDPVIGRLQSQYGLLRPVLFYSPYEAACAFTIGHRITIAQTRRIRERMSEEVGAVIKVQDESFAAFPGPQALLRLDTFPGVAPAKIECLHQLARAALEGLLDRARLRSLTEGEALRQLRQLPGIGDFFAQGILMRGAGLVDAVTDDDLTPRAIQLLYGLKSRPDRDAVFARAEAWRPYRMWAVVLLNVWLRSQPREVIGQRWVRGPARSRRHRTMT